MGPKPGGLTALQRTNCKFYPVEGNAQAILFAVAGMAETLDPAEVAGLCIETYQRAWHEIGGGQGDHDEKWNPQTRETADHSLPFLIAAMLTDRRIDETTFEPTRVCDRALRPLMDKISIVPKTDLTALHPAILRSRVALTLRNDDVVLRETEPQPGDWQRPFTDADAEAKYDAMAKHAGPAEAVAALLAALKDLPNASDVRNLTARMRAVAPGLQPAL